MMRLMRPVAVLVLGATLAFVPSALAASHHASHPLKGPRCAHNGVNTNVAGHANCGRHTGQSGTAGTGDQNPTQTTTGDQTGSGDDQSDTTATADDSQGHDSQS